LKAEALRLTLSKMPEVAKRKMFNAIPAPYQLIACYAGRADPVHERIVAKLNDQYLVKVKGQSDIVIFPIPYISPYNVNSILNPILLQVMALGYFHHFYRGQPVLRKGGALILCHPCHDEFDHEYHPSYIEFFNRLLPETRDSHELRNKYEEEFARNPSYVEMYRRGHAYHGTHPFFMWLLGRGGSPARGQDHRGGREERACAGHLGLGPFGVADRSDCHGAILRRPLGVDHPDEMATHRDGRRGVAASR